MRITRKRQLFLGVMCILLSVWLSCSDYTEEKMVTVTDKVVTPEQYGANGFDNKPDTEALQKAINSGIQVTLKNGATYIIDQTLVSSHSIKIATEEGAEKPAVILQKKQMSAFSFENRPSRSTHVIKNITVHQSYIIVDDTTDIQPGDLLHLKSSKLWYWDDRGYLTKGELHKIKKIEGKKVYLDRSIEEQYQVDKGEIVEVTAYPNKQLQLSNISFEHPKPYTTVMVKINYTTDTIIDRVSVKNSKSIGLFLNKTFNTVVKSSYIELGTTKDIPSGYGIQDYGGANNLITDSTFTKVRRGVDFSGDTPSRYGTVRHSKAVGYKKGVLASGNSGFGTHSTAEHIVFENNHIENFNYAFVTRGNDIRIHNNTASGFSQSFTAISFGNHVQVTNNTYTSTNGSSLESFLMILNTYRGSITATENTVNGLKGPFLKGNIPISRSTQIKRNSVSSNVTKVLR